MPDLRERVLYPPAGWLSLGLLAVMVLALGWSVQGAEWLDQLGFLVPVGLWALAIGAVLGVLGWSIVLALPIGALGGAWIILWTIGSEYYPVLSQGDRLLALRADALDWLTVVLDTGYPTQMAPYAIGLGVLMFATAFMAAFAVYRYHRVLDAILLLGTALIVNMSGTLAPLFGYLLLFVVAALLLWLRSALVTRREGWQRRRVNENLEVPAAIMRSGIVFAAGSVALAWVLTSVAVAAPLTDAWRSFDGVWTGVKEQFDGVFGSLTNPRSRITGTSFGPGFAVSGQWFSNDEEALVLAASRPLYLRTVTYDVYTGRGWERSDGPNRQVAAGENLFDVPTSERPTVADSVEIETIAIEMRQAIGRNLFTAGSPLKVYAPVVIHESGGQPVLGAIDAANTFGAGEGYTVSVAISEATEAELSAAGTDYPASVRALYLSTTGVTDRVRQLAEDLTAGAATPYEKAKALARYLSRDESFHYDTRGAIPKGDQDLVDFFLFDEAANRTGYCEYYASAMVMMARAVGLPARVAGGFAPGEETDDGTYLVRESDAHAWAEIYFPGYGWQIFEATKTVNPRFTRLSGDPTTVGPPVRGRDDLDPLSEWELGQPDDRIATLPSFDPIAGGFDPTQGEPKPEAEQAREGNAALMLALVALGALVVWWRVRTIERRWRLLPAGDRAWRQLTAAAQRAGVGPRPSETIYEYAGWLEEQLPGHRDPIRTVADGKVLQAYSGRRMTRTAGDRLDAAMARLRLPLVGLAVRRTVRRLLRRDAA